MTSAEGLPENGECFAGRRIFEAPTPSQLHSSFVPSTEEEDRLRETQQEILRTTDAVNEEIARIESTLRNVKAYREHLHTRAEQHRTFLSPIRRLPLELLGEIFLFSSLGHPPIWPHSDKKYSMPHVIGQVCSHWRKVSHALPKLWSELLLDFDYFKFCLLLRKRISFGDIADMERRSKEMFDVWLNRSGNEPLTFHIKSDFPDWTECHSLILCSLVEQAQRWVVASFSNWVIIAKYQQELAAVKDRFPNLTTLRMGFPHDGSIMTLPFDIFGHAPSLRSVALAGGFGSMKTFAIPWYQIVQVNLISWTLKGKDFLSIMNKAVNIESLTIARSFIGLKPASAQSVCLSHLRHLDIRLDGEVIPILFQTLIIPNLESLDIQIHNQMDASLSYQMLTRSQFHPTHLALDMTLTKYSRPEEDAVVLEVLAALQSITHLHLISRHPSQGIMRQLEYNRHQEFPPLLPNLTHIKLKDRSCFSIKETIDALSSRMENYDVERWGPWPDGLRGLQKIELCFGRPGSTYPELGALKTAAGRLGVDFSVCDSNWQKHNSIIHFSLPDPVPYF